MKNFILILALSTSIIFSSCSNPNAQVEKDIKMYSNTWDEIINNAKLDLFNETNFTKDVILKMQPENVVGIENAKAYYANFLTGFSDIEFKVVDIFGQGDKIVKHWNFKGKHSGDFFGIPATGKTVNIEGTTLVKMKDGKIAEEQDFMDNMGFMQQLGLVSDPNNLSVIDSAYAAFAVGEIPKVLAAMDAKVIWNEAESNALADGNPYIGPDAVLNGVFARIGADHEYFKLAVSNFTR
ncbi:MAG: ester cyclase [Flavobacteriaceae bacterium]|nr:ester cyclase [Flavobacteriaceae bacterium]